MQSPTCTVVTVAVTKFHSYLYPRDASVAVELLFCQRHATKVMLCGVLLALGCRCANLGC